MVLSDVTSGEDGNTKKSQFRPKSYLENTEITVPNPFKPLPVTTLGLTPHQRKSLSIRILIKYPGLSDLDRERRAIVEEEIKKYRQEQ